MTENNNIESNMCNAIVKFLGNLVRTYAFTKDILIFIRNYTEKRFYSKEKIEELGESFFHDLDNVVITEHNKIFLQMVHIYLFSAFESFNKNLFLELFKGKPELLKSYEKSLKYKEIIEKSSYDEIIHDIASKEVENFGRMNIDKFASKLKKLVNIDLSSRFKKWEGVRENYYRRNIIVHNNGFINEDYKKKIVTINNDSIGKELVNDSKYFEAIHNNLREYVFFIIRSINKKLKLNIPDNIASLIKKKENI